MAKKSTFDEKHESEVAKHEDEKDERNKWREKARGRREANQEVSEAANGRLSANLLDNVRDHRNQITFFSV
jgi:hypothetical protein